MRRRPFFIGVSGASASGKTSVCDIIMKTIGEKKCTLIPLDAFYVDLTLDEVLNITHYNFDHPRALDFELLEKCIRDILDWRATEVPLYSFAKNCRVGTVRVEAAPVLIIEGIHTFYQESIRNLMDMKIFINTEDDVRLSRKLIRDVKERGRTILGGLIQYNRFVKKGYEEFGRPTMKYADIIIPYGRRNNAATQFVVENIKLWLRESGVCTAESMWGTLNVLEPDFGKRVVVCREDLGQLKDILIKFWMEDNYSCNKIWVMFLAQKLVQLLGKSALGEGAELCPVLGGLEAEEVVERGSESRALVCLFHSAILDETVVSRLTTCVEKLKSCGRQVAVLTYFTAPALARRLAGLGVSVYTVLCGESLSVHKDLLTNEEGKFKTPTVDEYLAATQDLFRFYSKH